MKSLQWLSKLITTPTSMSKPCCTSNPCNAPNVTTPVRRADRQFTLTVRDVRVDIDDETFRNTLEWVMTRFPDHWAIVQAATRYVSAVEAEQPIVDLYEELREAVLHGTSGDNSPTA